MREGGEGKKEKKKGLSAFSESLSRPSDPAVFFAASPSFPSSSFPVPTNIGDLRDTSIGIAEVFRGKIVTLVSIMTDSYLSVFT